MQQFIRKTNFISVQKYGHVSVVHFNSQPSLSLSCRYLRSISYREYIQLIYGYLGQRRMPLPACAYDAIGRKFRDEQEFMGYEDDE